MGQGKQTIDDLVDSDMVEVQMLREWAQCHIPSPKEIRSDLALAELLHVLFIPINTAPRLGELDD